MAPASFSFKASGDSDALSQAKKFALENVKELAQDLDVGESYDYEWSLWKPKYQDGLAGHFESIPYYITVSFDHNKEANYMDGGVVVGKRTKTDATSRHE